MPDSDGDPDSSRLAGALEVTKDAFENLLSDGETTRSRDSVRKEERGEWFSKG